MGMAMWWRYAKPRQMEREPTREEPALPRTPSARERHRIEGQHDEGMKPPKSAGGEALPGGVREFLEAQFATDLGEVRVHSDQEAAERAAKLGASAFTA